MDSRDGRRDLRRSGAAARRFGWPVPADRIADARWGGSWGRRHTRSVGARPAAPTAARPGGDRGSGLRRCSRRYLADPSGSGSGRVRVKRHDGIQVRDVERHYLLAEASTILAGGHRLALVACHEDEDTFRVVYVFTAPDPVS